MRRIALWFAGLCGALSIAGHAAAQSAVALNPGIGNPGTTVTLTGAKFGAHEAIDVYLDNTDTKLIASNTSGGFTAQLLVPMTTSPGAHFITAVGRHSGLAAQAQFTVSTDWAQQGFDAVHTSFNPFENTLTPGNVASLGILWHKTSVTAGATPAIVGNQLFVSGISGIQARFVPNGQLLWNKETADNFNASPTVVGGVVYIGSVGAKVYALNAKTGAEVWKVSVGNSVTANAVVSGNVVYVACTDGKLYALNKATGAVLWKHPVGGAIAGTPVVANGLIYFGSDDKNFYALNAANGQLAWSYQAGDAVESSPIVSNGAVYFGSNDSNVYALNALSGHFIWSYSTNNAVYNAAAAAQNTIYVGSLDGLIYAFNAHSGVVRWSRPLSATVGAPVVADGVVYVAVREGGFFALNAATGDILWTAETLGTVSGSPAVVNGVVYLNAEGSDAYAFALGKNNEARHPSRRAPALSSLHPDHALLLTP